MSKPLKQGATYADLYAVPDNFVAEIIAGELYASSRPALSHSRGIRARHRARRPVPSRPQWTRGERRQIMQLVDAFIERGQLRRRAGTSTSG